MSRQAQQFEQFMVLCFQPQQRVAAEPKFVYLYPLPVAEVEVSAYFYFLKTTEALIETGI